MQNNSFFATEPIKFNTFVANFIFGKMTISELDKIYITFIDAIERKNNYKLATTIPNLFFDANFEKIDNGNYELSFEVLPEHISKGISIDYFFTQPFVLSAPKQNILVQSTDIINAKQSTNGNKPLKFNLQFRAFRGDFDDNLWRQSQQLCYLKFDRKLFEPHKLGVIFDITTKETEFTNGFCNAIRLNVDNIDLIFYHGYVTDNYGYCVIRPNSKVDYDVFRNIIDSIMIAFGLLSGYYMADEIFVFSQKSKNISDISYRYENLKQVIKSNAPIISSGHYEDVPQEKTKLTSQHFNDLVKLLYKNEAYRRSAILLITAGKETGCSKAALGAVALETLTNIIGKDISTKTVIDNKKTFTALKYKLTKTLKEFKDVITQTQFSTLQNKLNSINTIPNSNKIIDAFKILEIELNEEEIFCIKCRNTFLHGTLPKKEKDYKLLSDNEMLDVVSNRLVMLSAMLLLKKSGYCGYVIDKGVTDVMKWRMMRNGERVRSGYCLREICKFDIVK